MNKPLTPLFWVFAFWACVAGLGLLGAVLPWWTGAVLICAVIFWFISKAIYWFALEFDRIKNGRPLL